MSQDPGATGYDPAAAMAAFEQNVLMISVVEGPDLVVVAANAALRGFTADKPLTGLTLAEAYGEMLSQQAHDLVTEAYRTGEAARGHEWRFELEEASGDRFVAYLDFVFFPVRDADGAVSGVVTQAEDVTARVQARLQEQEKQAATEKRYQDALQVAQRLQETLLPQTLPLLPGVDVGARYLLATEGGAAGGDWFDAVLRPDGRLAVVVGDVVGHGMLAVAAMGQLRAVLHERLLSSAPLAEAVEDLDRYARTSEGARAATVCVGVLDPTSGGVEYVTAGHPPPLVVGAGGEGRFLATTGSGPLGTGSTFHPLHEQLGEDEVLLLYSDGIVERPGRTASENTVELAREAGTAYLDEAHLLSRSPRTVERVCELTLERLTRISGYADDITLLAVQRVPTLVPFHVSLDAVPLGVGVVRDELSLWLEALEVSAYDEMLVQHVAAELVTNAVDHAYPAGSPGRVEVSAEVAADGSLLLRVADRGTWSEVTPDPEGGRGLSMVRAMTDRVVVDRSGAGTVVEVGHRLSRPARLLTGRQVARPVEGPPVPTVPFAATLDDDTGTLHVQGPVDATSARQLRSVLRLGTRGGSRPLVVDLSRVTVLASAGVSVLYELHGPSVQLLACAGSPAQHVLELVALPYEGTGREGSDPRDP